MAGRRPKSLQGTHLFLKGRVYVWRREDPLTGKPIKRSTRSRSLELALRVATEFEEEWERRKAGLPNLDGWKKDLAALAEEWLAHQEREARASRPVIEAKRFRIGRALRELGLRTPADLADVARLHDRVMALEGKRCGRVIASRTNLRAAWQEPLKQLSAWLAENGRYLDRDPLASWKPIARGVRASKRRALMPDEMARSLQAADWLDAIHGRKHPSRIVWTLLLVTGAREGSIVSRDLEHFVRAENRIELGGDVGNKRRGAGFLDPRTAEELAAYLGARKDGPLLLSPAGPQLKAGKLLDGRLRAERLVDCWREAVGLGIVRELWPEDEPWSVETGHLVNQFLTRGRASVDKGGNPRRVRTETKRARLARERYVELLAGQLRAAWEERMRGVDVHALRKTHRTWALASGVPEVLIDRQLGHAARPNREGMDLLRVVSGSRVGRERYTDMRSALFDAARSAAAVRQLLDEAVGRLSESRAPTEASTVTA